MTAPRATFFDLGGTLLAYDEVGAGAPLICLPGGPMRAAVYLGDLGGLSEHRRLVRLDLRGTGSSAPASDPATYRVDRQVADVEALRVHLGLDRLDLLGHSGGGTLAVLYAAAYPRHVGRLVLICPSPRSVALEIPDEARRAVAQLRRAEPWFADAIAAFERIWAGHGGPAEWDAIAPFFWGRWDSVTQAHQAEGEGQQNAAAAQRYYEPGAIDGPAVRAALRELEAPVLLVTGEYDVSLPPDSAAALAAVFPRATLATQPGAGHSPWLDDPAWLVSRVVGFLG